MKNMYGFYSRKPLIGAVIKINVKWANQWKTNSKNKDKITGNNLQELQEKLDAAIRDERYEDAAKIRDEIKKLEKNNKDNK